MNPYEIIEKYYDSNSKLYKILIRHSEQVRDRALKVVDKHPELKADRKFIEEAAMLHDIGIFLTDAPKIECFGKYKYICHGYLGADIVRKEGYPKHALVCERHTGVGLSKEYIIENDLPVPHRDLRPKSIEEQIICFSDKFYSKTKLNKEVQLEDIVDKLEKYGKDQPQIFMDWYVKFN